MSENKTLTTTSNSSFVLLNLTCYESHLKNKLTDIGRRLLMQPFINASEYIFIILLNV